MSKDPETIVESSDPGTFESVVESLLWLKYEDKTPDKRLYRATCDLLTVIADYAANQAPEENSPPDVHNSQQDNAKSTD